MVWFGNAGGSVWCVQVYQETAGFVTQAPEQHEQVTKGHTPRTKDGVTKVKGHGSQEKGGARSKEGSIQDDHDHPPKTTTTMQHPIAGGRGGVK